MDKKILIIGAGAVALVGVLAIKHAKSNAQQAAQQSTPVSADTGFIASMAPVSGGISSGGDYSTAQTMQPTQAGNSGTTSTGGGFDIMSLLGGLLTTQTQGNQASVTANEHNNDSAVLATIVSSNGTASVSHSTNGTTIINTPNGDPYDNIIASVYKQQLGRDPDSGGLAYFKSAMMNTGASVLDVTKAIQSSPEYLKNHPVATK